MADATNLPPFPDGYDQLDAKGIVALIKEQPELAPRIAADENEREQPRTTVLDAASAVTPPEPLIHASAWCLGDARKSILVAGLLAVTPDELRDAAPKVVTDLLVTAPEDLRDAEFTSADWQTLLDVYAAIPRP